MGIYFKKNTQTAIIPKKGSARAAGYDLYADLGIGNDLTIFPGQIVLVKTGISVATPEDYYLRVAPRSGLALKNGINVLAGVVDEDYRGEVGVVLINHGTTKFAINHGDRVAQGIITKIAEADLAEYHLGVDDVLPETARGEGGWGSTGVSVI